MNKKISQLRDLTLISGQEEFPVAFGGITYKLKIADIAQTITATSVGLDRVQNIAPMDMPISTAMTTALGMKANANHVHAVSDISGLTAALDAKAQRVHYHVLTDISDFASVVQGQITVALGVVEW